MNKLPMEALFKSCVSLPLAIAFPRREIVYPLDPSPPDTFKCRKSVDLPAGAMMFSDFKTPSVFGSIAAASIILVCYVIALYLYRVFLHPLAKYPGPKLAAASNWYEFYYDVYRQGDFTRHIQELHKTYGMYFLLTLL
jgi:hypothetical protein